MVLKVDNKWSTGSLLSHSVAFVLCLNVSPKAFESLVCLSFRYMWPNIVVFCYYPLVRPFNWAAVSSGLGWAHLVSHNSRFPTKVSQLERGFSWFIPLFFTVLGVRDSWGLWRSGVWQCANIVVTRPPQKVVEIQPSFIRSSTTTSRSKPHEPMRQFVSVAGLCMRLYATSTGDLNSGVKTISENDHDFANCAVSVCYKAFVSRGNEVSGWQVMVKWFRCCPRSRSRVSATFAHTVMAEGNSFSPFSLPLLVCEKLTRIHITSRFKFVDNRPQRAVGFRIYVFFPFKSTRAPSTEQKDYYKLSRHKNKSNKVIRFLYTSILYLNTMHFTEQHISSDKWV